MDWVFKLLSVLSSLGLVLIIGRFLIASASGKGAAGATQSLDQKGVTVTLGTGATPPPQSAQCSTQVQVLLDRLAGNAERQERTMTSLGETQRQQAQILDRLARMGDSQHEMLATSAKDNKVKIRMLRQLVEDGRDRRHDRGDLRHETRDILDEAEQAIDEAEEGKG